MAVRFETADEWMDAAAQLTLHPDWSVRVEVLVPWWEVAVHFDHRALDSHAPHERERRIRFTYSVAIPTPEPVKYLHHLWRRSWQHEADEWFRHNGELVDDPHARWL